MWSMLNHKNVLPLLGFQLEGSGFPSLISEWMNNGTALSYVIQNPDHNILSMVNLYSIISVWCIDNESGTRDIRGSCLHS